ncbi:hypothetical protein [Streptomyces chartreusis]|uniref:hypothetical protein n=1 Tax=Streptomyces chartreusis TaxID=1969 RepID=UPI0036537160
MIDRLSLLPTPVQGTPADSPIGRGIVHTPWRQGDLAAYRQRNPYLTWERGRQRRLGATADARQTCHPASGRQRLTHLLVKSSLLPDCRKEGLLEMARQARADALSANA